MDLGTVHAVQLRDLWAGEATHFTPWLSKNLNLLGAELGIDLELEATEGGVGDFYADIVARDLSSNKRVIIENQFGSTDHKHLGQLITYAANLGAGAVIWIAETIRPEHKAAIDFLNLNLKEGLRLFAVQASAIRIDSSKPAFLLNVVSMPNESSLVSDTAPAPSETKERYRAYFQGLIDELRETHKFTNARTGQPQNWYAFASDNSKVYKYSAVFKPGDRVGVEVYIDCGDKSRNEAIFDCLFSHREAIESALGHPLSWERLESRRASRVALYRDGDIEADPETLAEIRVWTIQNLLKFKSIFPSWIQRCDSTSTSS